MRQLARKSELAAMLALQESIELAFLGCRFDRGLVGSISLTLGNDALGAWWYDYDRFQFATTAFNRVEYTARSVEEVVLVTKEIAAKHAMYLSYQKHGIALHAGGRPPAQRPSSPGR